MSNINIHHESAEFLNLQIHDKCCEECRNRLTKVNLTEKAKNLLKPVLDFLYWGDEKVSYNDSQLLEFRKILSKFKIKVSAGEMNLIHYIALIVDGCTEKAKFDALSDAYAKAIKFNKSGYLISKEAINKTSELLKLSFQEVKRYSSSYWTKHRDFSKTTKA